MKERSIFDVNGGAAQLSKCGRYIACGFGTTLDVIDSNSAEIVSSFPCTHKIKDVDWHFASYHVLSVLDKVPIVQAFSLSDPEWICRIEGGDLGLESAKWGPKGYYILTLAEFGVRIAVWSLTGESVCYIDNPIIKKKDELSFSNDGNYLAVLTGPLDRYKIMILCTETWSTVQVIECTHNIAIPSNPLWSPINLHLVIGEMMDLKCAFLEVYSFSKPKLCGSFKKLKSVELCRISKMVWVPTGQFLLVGCHDEKVYVLNYITWGVFVVLHHSMVVHEEKCEVYREERLIDEFEVVSRRPVTMSKVRRSVKRGLLPGVTGITCDASNRHIATQCASMPAVVFVWEIGSFNLKTVVALHRAVVSIKWHPIKPKLMICSGSRTVSIWTSGTPSRIRHSSTFNGLPFVQNCFWCPGEDNISVVGSSLLYILRGDD